MSTIGRGFLFLLLLSSSALADCDDAKRKCKSECSSYLTKLRVSKGGKTALIDTHNTDYPSKCEDACKRGESDCEDASKVDKCDDFKSGCKRACPSSSMVYVYFSSDDIESGYVSDSNANSKCEDACAAGYRRCD